METCAAPSALTQQVDLEKEKSRIDAIKNFTYIRNGGVYLDPPGLGWGGGGGMGL